MKNLLIGCAAALALLASNGAFAKGSAKKAGSGSMVMTKKGHKSMAHVCNKDGAAITTTEKTKGKPGRTIKREKTCVAEGGTWEMVNKDMGKGSAKGSGSM